MEKKRTPMQFAKSSFNSSFKQNKFGVDIDLKIFNGLISEKDFE
jgi:hypothetical protein